MRISDWSADVCSSDLFGIGPCYKGFVAIAPILSEGDFPEQEIAQLIDAERCRQFKRIRDIADRFRHFFSSVEEKAVAEHLAGQRRSEEHTSELQSLMRLSYAVFCLKKKKKKNETTDVERRHT